MKHQRIQRENSTACQVADAGITDESLWAVTVLFFWQKLYPSRFLPRDAMQARPMPCPFVRHVCTFCQNE